MPFRPEFLFSDLRAQFLSDLKTESCYVPNFMRAIKNLLLRRRIKSEHAEPDVVKMRRNRNGDYASNRREQSRNRFNNLKLRG